ncbi:hypothetical protein Micbo1qcDRAFT_165211, partial [Microdochium bolleyi]
MSTDAAGGGAGVMLGTVGRGGRETGVATVVAVVVPPAAVLVGAAEPVTVAMAVSSLASVVVGEGACGVGVLLPPSSALVVCEEDGPAVSAGVEVFGVA